MSRRSASRAPTALEQGLVRRYFHLGAEGEYVAPVVAADHAGVAVFGRW